MTSSSFRRQAAGRAYDFLPPEPVKRDARQGHAADIADAEFVVIGSGRAPEPRAGSFNDNRRCNSATAPRQPPSFRPASSLARYGEARLQQASAKGFAAFVFAVCVLVFGLSGGFSGLARPSTVDHSSPLHFTHVTATPRDANGMRVLLINGIIDNMSGTTQLVRPIRADLFVDEQLTASIVIDPSVDAIYGGQSRGFSTRVQYAGGKMPEVRLSFLP
ncbi:hypothetical protein ASC97_26005 [Rhizobium sp. Root1203]|uniref:hypothetical protein n=1 Tax=Rhizobium sp. Root1203 TaxID=1736427 RepID=UPI00070D584A|nr:hypothetical protein [Rhizobium sp. Root1203]KQV24364.1 hypothetical protein ASC97_26005 [Rhizobium sp. Root1203]